MPIDEAVRTIHIAINALVLWFVWHGPWRRACQERYRQKLFEVRDELFDLACSGRIGFTDTAYVALRSHINSMIRFSHIISVTRLAIFIVFQRYIGKLPQTHPSLISALSQVKGLEAKNALMAINDKVRGHTIKHLLFSSPHVLIAGPALLMLQRLTSPKFPTTLSTPVPQWRPVAVSLIEIQARDAYSSESLKRRHDTELAYTR